MITMPSGEQRGRDVRDSRRPSLFVMEIGRDLGRPLQLEMVLAGGAIVVLVRVRLSHLDPPAVDTIALMPMCCIRCTM